jgi:hypothetical protein
MTKQTWFACIVFLASAAGAIAEPPGPIKNVVVYNEPGR